MCCSDGSIEAARGFGSQFLPDEFIHTVGRDLGTGCRLVVSSMKFVDVPSSDIRVGYRRLMAVQFKLQLPAFELGARDRPCAEVRQQVSPR